MNTEHIREVLGDLGYTLRDYGGYFRTRPLYRDSNNDVILSINKDTGRWKDFKEGISGGLEDLVKLTLDCNIEDARKYLKTKGSDRPVAIVKPEVKQRKTLNSEFLNNLIKNNKYWNDRGISDETLEEFNGGVCESGKMLDRYVFPIHGERGKLIGVSGRDINSDGWTKRPKWKHIGDKSSWVYPSQVNEEHLKLSKRVILLESIGDMLSLWENKIKSTIVTFGLDISTAVLNKLLRLDPNSVIISFNNDSESNHAGNLAAQKAKKKLLKYFDEEQVKISLPLQNDFGEMTSAQVSEWYTNL
jgi:DNA primase